MTKKRIPPTTTNSNIGRNPFQKNVELTVFLRFPSIFTILCLGIGNNTYLISRVSVFSPPTIYSRWRPERHKRRKMEK
jgi:hypothetical protein